MKQNLRECEFYKRIKPAGEKWRWESYPTAGTFHCWSVQYEEFENGPGNYIVGIVEDEQGQVHVVHDPTKIRFINQAS